MAVRKSKTASVAKSAYQRTPREAAVIKKLQGRRADEAPRLKVSTVGNISKIETDHPDLDIGIALLMEALATTDIDFMSGLLTQLANAGGKVDEQRLNFMFSVVKNIKPRDQIEAMLAAQMAAVHVATMRSSRSLAEAESLEHRDSAERTLNKLMRTFAMQMGALKQYRTGGEQTVKVQYVNVSDGGQAIVGDVTQNPLTTASDRANSSPPPLTQSRVPAMEVIHEPPLRATPVKRKSSK
jgi:hypothetical protein